jgi:hypothetical protein
VCLDARKAASRHKTTTKIEQQSRQKGAKNSTKKQTCKQRRVFPQPVKPAIFLLPDGMAEAMPFQNQVLKQLLEQFP